MSKKIISEVAILRPLALFLVVLHHCFAPYSGFWSQIINMDGNDCYWWFGKFVTYFHVELFIFISGYIFAYQNIDLGRRSNFIDFFLSKLKRLYLPCLIFSVVYYFCFYNQGGFDLSNFLLRVTSGCGHLWFLPVLLWCFVVGWIIDHYQYNKFYIFCLLSFCFILPIPYLPMGINVAFHYVFYFYLGYLFWIYQEKFLEYAKFKYISILLVGYLFLVVFNEYVNGFIVNKYILFGVQ